MPTEFDVFVNPFRGVPEKFLRGFERGLALSKTQQREATRQRERSEDIERREERREEDIGRRGTERAEDIERKAGERAEDIEARKRRDASIEEYRKTGRDLERERLDIQKERLEIDRAKLHNTTISAMKKKSQALLKGVIDYRKNYHTYQLNEFDIKNTIEKYSISKARMETIYSESARDYQRMKEVNPDAAEFPVVIDIQKGPRGKDIPGYLINPETGDPQMFQKSFMDNFFRSGIPSRSYHPVFNQADYKVPGAMNYNRLSSEIGAGQKAFDLNKIRQTKNKDSFIAQYQIDPDLVSGMRVGIRAGRFQDIIKITDRYQFDYLFSPKQQRDIAEEMRENPGLLRNLRKTIMAEKSTSGRDREWLFWRLAYEVAQLKNPSLPKVPYEMLGKGRIQSIDELKGTYNRPLEVSLPPQPMRKSPHREIEAPRPERPDDEEPISEIAKLGSKLEGMILEHRRIKRLQETQERRGYGRRLEWWEMVKKPKKKK